MKSKILSKIALVLVFVLCAVSLFSCNLSNSGDDNLSGSVFNDSGYSVLQDTYLKVDGIDGEAKDSKHDKWIDVVDFSFNSASSAANNGQSSEVFEFSHLVDKATPILQSRCLRNTVISKMQLQVCKTLSGKQEVFFDVILESCKIFDIKISVDEKTGKAIETVTVIPGKISWKATEIGSDNSIKGYTEETYSIQHQQ